MKKILVGVAAAGALVFCVAASAGPDREIQLIPRDGVPKLSVVNDEAATLGRTATGAGEAAVFKIGGASAYVFYVDKLDDSAGNFSVQRMIFGNGWVAGNELVSYSEDIFISGFNSTDTVVLVDITMELWDGDPFGVDTTCCGEDGVGDTLAGPIAGATCTFTGLTEGAGYSLDCQIPKTVINCDRVFPMMFVDRGCRLYMDIPSSTHPYDPSGLVMLRPEVGDGNMMGAYFSCENGGYCATPSTYAAGTCCDGGQVCDHTAADPAAWTGDCSHRELCGDNIADLGWLWYDGAPTYFYQWVGAAYAQTDTLMQVIPMSVDAIPPAASPSDVTIAGNTVTIDQGSPGGERHLWFEIYVSDWDPGDIGMTLKAWQAGLDASGYAAGLMCTLTPWRPACTNDADCIALQGEVGTFMDALKGGCNIAGLPPNVCAAAFSPGRPDFVFYMTNYLGGIDQSTLNYRYGATLQSPPIVSPHIGNMYMGSLTLKTMCDCPAGNFHVGMGLPNANSNMVQGNRVPGDEFDNQFIPLLGVKGADVIFPTGQCCNISENPSVCISDTVTRCQCEELGEAGSFDVNFDMTKTCADPCIECLGPDDTGPCADGDACTVDTCVDLFCVHTPVVVPAGSCCDYLTGDDVTGGGTITPLGSDQCTTDYCDNAGGCGASPASACGVPTFDVLEGDPCYDGEPCLTVNDTCLANADCVGTDILTVPCTDNATCEALTQDLGSCNFVTGYCRCVPPSLNFIIHPSQKPNDACFLVGETVTVDVQFKDVPVTVNGGQFVVNYDPTCLAFVSIVPGGDPYTFEISEMVDEAAGSIFYAVGVDPFGGVGVVGADELATITFTKIGVCETCNMCFGGENPVNTYLVDNGGWVVADVELNCSDDVMENDYLGLDVPDDIVMNVNSCDSDTAFPMWASPTATSSCYDVDLVCTGPWAPGDPHYVDPMTGGAEVPVGTYEFCCTATSTVCGDSVSDCWTVTVNDEVTLDVTLQVSPVIAADDLLRCIKFELFADCVTDPLIIEKDVTLGGLWDHTGHFTEAIKVPADGNWICITARDQLHTLRGCDYLECEDGVYTAIFKGDPFFGGNWLIGGNLDGFKKEIPTASHDVIDILDFGQFVTQFAANYGTGDTPCGTQGPNADINGDGVVSVLDFTFVTMNFLASSKECCCGGAVAGAPTLEISVEDLRANGLGDLSVGDLNRDGVLNATDMASFMNGVRPTMKSSHDRAGSSLR